MHTFYLVYFPGAKLARVITSLEDIEGTQRSSIVFMVRDSNPERGHSVITAIEDLYNHWILGPAEEYERQYKFGASGNYIRPNQNWRSDLQDIYAEDGGNLSYVYMYAEPKDYELWRRHYDATIHGFCNQLSDDVKPFYIGRGVNNRWLDHINEAMQYVSLQNVPNGAHFEFGKILKIYEFLKNTAEQHCQELVRKVAIFSGPYSEEKAVAAELFLINHYGVYQLKNLTSGDMTCKGVEFIARPNQCIGSPEWLEVAGEFAQNGVRAYTQKRANHLQTFALNKELPSFLTDVDEIHPGLSIYRTNTTMAFTTDGTDVFIQMRIRDEYGALLVMLDLKISDVNPSCVINLRPASGRKAEFVKLIADKFFEGDITEASSRVKNQSNDPFFKPCAANSDGRRDVWFDFMDVDQPVYQIVDCPWLGHGPLWSNASLRDVLHVIVSKFVRN